MGFGDFMKRWGEAVTEELFGLGKIKDRELKKKLALQRVEHEKEIVRLQEKARAAEGKKQREAMLQIEQMRIEHKREELKILQEYHQNQAQKEITSLKLEHFLGRWPLRTPPDLLSGDHAISQERDVLTVILGKGNVAPYTTILHPSIQNRLSVLLNTWMRHTSTHPIDFHFSWRDDCSQDTAAIDCLYSILRSRPTLVIIPTLMNNGSILLFRVVFWGPRFASGHPEYFDILELPFQDLLIFFAKKTAQSWENMKRDYSLSKEVNPIDDHNLTLINKEQNLREKGLGEVELCGLPFRNAYQFSAQHYEKAAEYITATAICTIGMFADAYYLAEYAISPQLPTLAETLSGGAADTAISAVLPCYRKLMMSLRVQPKDRLLSIRGEGLRENSCKILCEKIAYALWENGYSEDEQANYRMAQDITWSKPMCEFLLDRNQAVERSSDLHALAKILYDIHNDKFKTVITQDSMLPIAKALLDSNRIILAMCARKPIVDQLYDYIEKTAYDIYEKGIKGNDSDRWSLALNIIEGVVEKTIEANSTPREIISDPTEFSGILTTKCSLPQHAIEPMFTSLLFCSSVERAAWLLLQK